MRWKTVSIIFIVLFIAETIFIFYAWGLGNDMIKKESQCAINICGNKYDSFSYDEYMQVCSCYKDGQVLHQEIIP